MSSCIPRLRLLLGDTLFRLRLRQGTRVDYAFGARMLPYRYSTDVQAWLVGKGPVLRFR